MKGFVASYSCSSKGWPKSLSLPVSTALALRKPKLSKPVAFMRSAENSSDVQVRSGL